MKQNRTDIVREIMMEFADNTGLSSAVNSPRRYLWTDAFAVCNFLELYHRTDDNAYRVLALRLVEQVHNILGRHRDDDPRSGWISGLDEQDGKMHPTAGGLRIGKKLNERGIADTFDEDLEWERDGQYYHYLTKWMHALNRLGSVTGEPAYNTWAREMAKKAHLRFTYLPRRGGKKRMYWKMSIDLSRPLVPSMGQHDPLDGFITYAELQHAAPKNTRKSVQPDLSGEIKEMAGMCEGADWATDDPLGIGELLCNALKAALLIRHSGLPPSDLPGVLMAASLLGIESFSRKNPLRLPAAHRLAFRELGLSVGLHAAEKMQEMVSKTSASFLQGQELNRQLVRLMQYAPLSRNIETFWLDGRNREAASWRAHQDINMVMLATSLAPDSYLAV